jgi:endonuclease YncB( thermonuclease family)
MMSSFVPPLVVLTFFVHAYSTKAKFGNPAMPLADEATDYTYELVNDRIVRIKLLRRDQYNRAVAKVTTRGILPFTKKDVTLKLAERGLATLYTGGGAEYDVGFSMCVASIFVSICIVD